MVREMPGAVHMSERDDRTTPGMRLGFGLGVGDPAANGRAAQNEDVPFRILVVGDFGSDADGAPQGLSLKGEVPANMAEQLGIAASYSVANLLGRAPDPLPVHLPIRRMSDFSAKAVSATVEPLRRAASLRAAVAGGLRNFESYADLDLLVAALTPVVAPRPAPSFPAASDVDRLLSMFDLGADAPPPGSSVLPAGSGPKGAVGVIDDLVTRQLALVRGHPRLAAIEAAWRGLRLLTGDGLPARADIDLLAVGAGQAPACLIRDVVPDELEASGRTRLACIVVAGAIRGDEDGLGHLALCAAAGAALQVPVIVSLDQAFFDSADTMVQVGWHLLRSDPSAAWLAACLGDVALGVEGRDQPLWGEPGWAVAALALASFRQYGWPNELANASAMTLDGLDVHEIGGAAWPLRRPMNRTKAAELAAMGVVTLAAQANRDRVFLAAAPCLGAGNHLAGQMVAARLLAILRSRPGATSAEPLGRALQTVLSGIGQVTRVRAGSAGRFDIAVQLRSPAQSIAFSTDA